MPRFIAKPVVVEAHPYTGAPLPMEFAIAVLRHRGDGSIEIATGDGPRVCRMGDYVFRDNTGSFHVLTESRFEAMFEEHVTAPIEAAVKRPYNRKVYANG